MAGRLGAAGARQGMFSKSSIAMGIKMVDMIDRWSSARVHSRTRRIAISGAMGIPIAWREGGHDK